MKKYLVIILLVFFCFGCEANYKLEINKDLSVSESIIGLEDDDFYSHYNGRSKDWVIEAILWNVREEINSNNYKIESVSEDDLYGSQIYKTYSNIDEYFNSSTAYLQLYDTFNHSNDDGIITIELKDKLPINNDSLTRFKIDSAKISIKVPFKVLENNADSFDKNTNTYTWNINADDSKEIYIKFDSKDYIGNVRNIYLLIGIGVLVLSGIVFMIVAFRKKQKSINKF